MAKRNRLELATEQVASSGPGRGRYIQGGICREDRECGPPMVVGKSMFPQFFLNFSSNFTFTPYFLLPQIPPWINIISHMFIEPRLLGSLRGSLSIIARLDTKIVLKR